MTAATAVVAVAAVGLRRRRRRRRRRRVRARLKKRSNQRMLTMRPGLIHPVVLAWAQALVRAALPLPLLRVAAVLEMEVVEERVALGAVGERRGRE